MIEQIATQVEEEIGHDDGGDICPSGKAFFRCKAMLSLFGISSLPSPFSLAIFGVEMFCLLLSVTLESRIRLARIQGWLRGENRARLRAAPSLLPPDK